MSVDKDVLSSWAQELGFAEFALCPIRDFAGERQQVSRQEPLAERRQLRFDPGEDEPEAKSMAVMLWPYEPAGDGSQEALFVDSYYFASNAAYHAARELEARCLNAGCFAKANVSYPAKASAVRAGLGFIGKNDLLFTKCFGTRVVIILMLTGIDAVSEAQVDAQSLKTCLNCGLCVKACPSGALDHHGMSHPERCMRNFMMEGVVVPEHLRSRMGMRLLGCDICQRVCPMQPKRPSQRGKAFPLADFMTTDDQVFAKSVSLLAQEIGRNTARPQRVRAQAALLAGNSGNAAYLPVLMHWANSPFDAVSTHAKWAIERIEMAGSGS